MSDKKILLTSNPYKNSVADNDGITKTIHYGEVVSNSDETDGRRIKVRIPLLDNNINNNNDLPYAFPLLPAYFHVIPQVGEIVRVFIEDYKLPNRGRLYLGSIISQPHKIEFDGYYTALSTTDMGLLPPDKSPKTYADAKDIYPDSNDVGIVGRYNNDVLLKKNKIVIRVGKHENDNKLKLNTKNPGTILLNYSNGKNGFESTLLEMSNRIALISHNESKTFKVTRLNDEDIDKIFEELYPLARGTKLLEFLLLIKNAIIGHIHGYSGLTADKNKIIKDLENFQLDTILNKNILIN